MKKFVLLSCVSQKINERSKAKDLYISPLFKKSLAYAYKLKPDAIYILSAKHHLIELDRIIEPYNVTLNKMKKNDRLNWGKKVIDQLKDKSNLEKDTFIMLAGNKYIMPIKDKLINIEQPFYKMRLGERLKYLNKELGYGVQK